MKMMLMMLIMIMMIMMVVVVVTIMLIMLILAKFAKFIILYKSSGRGGEELLRRMLPAETLYLNNVFNI